MGPEYQGVMTRNGVGKMVPWLADSHVGNRIQGGLNRTRAGSWLDGCGSVRRRATGDDRGEGCRLRLAFSAPVLSVSRMPPKGGEAGDKGEKDA